MAATAHLTLAAPDNEKFTVQSAPGRLPRRKASLQAQDQAMDPTTIGRLQSPFVPGSVAAKDVSDRAAHSPGWRRWWPWRPRWWRGGLGLGLGRSAALTANWCIATSTGLLRTASYIRFPCNGVCARSELALSQEIPG